MSDRKQPRAYRIEWVIKVPCEIVFEADSAEHALELFATGEYHNRELLHDYAGEGERETRPRVYWDREFTEQLRNPTP